jgi:tetratricopeptide (TPR) repeat protein
LFWSLVFAVHPLATEPVNYLSSRSELLAAAGLLAAFWLWEQTDSRGAVLGSAVAFTAGLLAKESAIVLPALLLIADGLHGRLSRPRLRRYLPHAVVAALYLMLQAGVTGFLTRAVATAPVRSLLVQWGTQAKAAIFYLKLLLVPVGQSVDHPFRESDLFGLIPILGLALLGSLAWLAWQGRRRWPWLALAVAWIGLTLAPTALVPLNVLVNEHRLYLPLVGLVCGLHAVLPAPHARGSRLLWGVLLAGIGLLALLAISRNRVWQDEETLWADAARRGPTLVRPLVYLGNQARQQGKAAEAVVHFRRALELEPGHPVATANLANALQDLGQTREAISLLRTVLAAHPEGDEMRYNLAGLLRQTGQLPEARAEYLRVSPQSPHQALALNNLGTVYEGEGRLDSALACYRRALVREPQLAEAGNNLERLRRVVDRRLEELFEQGDPVAVESLARAVLAVDEGRSRPRFFLAASLFAQRRYAESLEENQRLVADRPDDAEARLQLGNVLTALGRRDEARAVYRELADRPAAGTYGQVAAARLRDLAAR